MNSQLGAEKPYVALERSNSAPKLKMTSFIKCENRHFNCSIEPSLTISCPLKPELLPFKVGELKKQILRKQAFKFIKTKNS